MILKCMLIEVDLRNSVIHLVVEQRRDMENERWAKSYLAFGELMDELKFLHKNRVGKVS